MNTYIWQENIKKLKLYYNEEYSIQPLRYKNSTKVISYNNRTNQSSPDKYKDRISPIFPANIATTYAVHHKDLVFTQTMWGSFSSHPN